MHAFMIQSTKSTCCVKKKAWCKLRRMVYKHFCKTIKFFLPFIYWISWSKKREIKIQIIQLQVNFNANIWKHLLKFTKFNATKMTNTVAWKLQISNIKPAKILKTAELYGFMVIYSILKVNYICTSFFLFIRPTYIILQQLPRNLTTWWHQVNLIFLPVRLSWPVNPIAATRPIIAVIVTGAICVDLGPSSVTATRLPSAVVAPIAVSWWKQHNLHNENEWLLAKLYKPSKVFV